MPDLHPFTEKRYFRCAGTVPPRAGMIYAPAGPVRAESTRPITKLKQPKAFCIGVNAHFQGNKELGVFTHKSRLHEKEAEMRIRKEK